MHCVLVLKTLADLRLSHKVPKPNDSKVAHCVYIMCTHTEALGLGEVPHLAGLWQDAVSGGLTRRILHTKAFCIGKRKEQHGDGMSPMGTPTMVSKGQ